ncbi:hypothetical protein GCM10010398_72480 [Streptomyces fimbriatus]
MVAPLSRFPSPGSSPFSSAAEFAEATGESGEEAAGHCDWNPPAGMFGTAEGEAGSEAAVGRGEDEGEDAGASLRSSSA